MWPIGWSADGEWIYGLDSAARSFARLSLRTGGIEQIGRFPEGRRVHSCALTPDLRVIVCSLVDETFDAWLMSDFDPDMR